jgi:two-component system, chemotaxis family, protein-glutamate methylesterase/glutaminase
MKPTHRPVHGGGVLVAGAKDLPLAATLGSCVAVAVVCVERKMAGLNHILLPSPENASKSTDISPTHFALESIRLLLKGFKDQGCGPSDLKVVVVGGASSGAGPSVGPANVREVRKVLQSFGILSFQERVGGKTGWQVRVDPNSGCIDVRPLAAERRVRVAVVDDSLTVRKLIAKSLSLDPNFEIVGEAANGEEAQGLWKVAEPDALTLDIQMPIKSGLDFLRSTPVHLRSRIILVSDCSPSSGHEVMEGLSLGAFDFLQKPSANDLAPWGERLRELLNMAAQNRSLETRENASALLGTKSPPLRAPFDRILMGSSTGGTEVVKQIVERLPEDSPPVFIVQHMPAAFTGAFASRLAAHSRISVVEAKDGVPAKRGMAYVAPGGKQMWLEKGVVRVRELPPVNRFAPSVDFLFERVSTTDAKSAVAILLTGMGQDGAKGMLYLKNSGATTISQSEASCLVYGMPRAADELGASQLRLSPEEIVSYLVSGSTRCKKTA